MRLGVYADLSYRRDPEGVSAPLSFISWVAGLGDHVDELVIFGRVHPTPGRSAYPVAGPRVRFVPLPYYEHLRRPSQVFASSFRSVRRWHAELHRLDAVLLFGPHPLAVLFGLAARRSGLPVIVGVRQDFPSYVRSRVTEATARWAVPAAVVLEGLHRRMVRWGGAIVVGDDLGRRYQGANRRVLVTGISLVSSDELVDVTEAVERAWPGSHRALSVGRLDPEKNPLLLIDVLAALRTRGPWTMAVAGTGSLDAELRRKATPDLHLLGTVDGADLRSLYRASAVLVHVSWTEGLPQVLFEAAAAGTPIVATAVGGVAAALDHGGRGMLVPPGDAHAVAHAIHRLEAEPALRAAVVSAALEWVAGETRERQTARVVSFIGSIAQG